MMYLSLDDVHAPAHCLQRIRLLVHNVLNSSIPGGQYSVFLEKLAGRIDRLVGAVEHRVRVQ